MKTTKKTKKLRPIFTERIEDNERLIRNWRKEAVYQAKRDLEIAERQLAVLDTEVEVDGTTYKVATLQAAWTAYTDGDMDVLASPPATLIIAAAIKHLLKLEAQQEKTPEGWTRISGS